MTFDVNTQSNINDKSVLDNDQQEKVYIDGEVHTSEASIQKVDLPSFRLQRR